jgi:ParB-like chromosome segregation protein Spo0J
MIKISDIKPNPNNPRIIKDDKFKKLVQSLKDFPEMMALRPIIIDSENMALGGNMRLKALQELGYKEIPDSWVKHADQLTDEQKREFIIKDNVGYGDWQWEQLANEWDQDQLTSWGLDLPLFLPLPAFDELIGEDKNKPAVMKITFKSPEQLQSAEPDITATLSLKLTP